MAYRCYLCKRKARIMYEYTNKKLVCKDCQEELKIETIEIDTLKLHEISIKRLKKQLEQERKFVESIKKVDYY